MHSPPTTRNDCRILQKQSVPKFTANMYCICLSIPDKKCLQHTSEATECPKIDCKSVLHLLRYIASLYSSRCSTDLR